MDSDRPPPPHRTASTSSSSSTSDLFICFTSRHHSSSMKLSSKSILSPGRAGGRDPPFSLTTSLSRRLRTNRSIKGGASPALFPTTAKKRNGGFENQEPSSPKVTCIGQVRIKSKKKQGKRLRSLSRRHSIGDVSFRKLERSRDGFSKSTNLGTSYHPGSSSFGSNQETLPEHRHNPRWVHLPLTICEALRAFGSEFSCLFPCRSSCFSPATERVKVEGDRQSSGSCARVFTRWLVDFHDGDDEGRRRDVELVVENVEDVEGVGDKDDGEEDGSIRASRRHVFDDLEIVNDRIIGSMDEARVSICIPPKNALLLMRCRSDPLKMEALANRLWQSTVSQDDESDEQDEDFIDIEQELQRKTCNSNESKPNQETYMKQSIEEEQLIDENEEEEMTYFGSLFDEITVEDKEEAREFVTQFAEIEEDIEQVKDLEKDFQDEDKVTVTEFAERSETAEEGLPECLLLMMYEPKLSMEVSKETWVSSKDFIRRPSSRKKPPPPPPPSTAVKPADVQSKVSTTSATTTASASKHAAAAAAVQPGRSSCSLPAPSSMAEMLEQKLVNAVGYEPFVLTRCKSEPMRTAAAKLAPDNCFWKNRKLEPLRRASFGVGAAGVGF
ncbi:hypothetical protein SSX86_005806 [Deinandra increscens subsp. villosa]|uniref:Uncharacterized protein n=1 Tax=Deinandra increscens subsp. villosa TaxID=3103831 RepID=A0AAP0DUL5_9ASTR